MFWKILLKNSVRRLGVAYPNGDALREIAEFFAEQVDAADVRRVRMHADAQRQIILPAEVQVGKGHT